MRIAYYYRKYLFDGADGAAKHERVGNLLAQLHEMGRIAEYTIEDYDSAFPTDEAHKELSNRLRDFALRHHVGLARSFGSNRYGFTYPPEQFLLVYEGDALREVFPCEVGEEIRPLEYLERFASGQPWTTRTARAKEGKKHATLVAQIASEPDLLEPGLTFRSQSVHLSRDFGEVGYVDLVFEDRSGRLLLVEVKAGPEELDKATGQIFRYRQLFAQQNGIEESTIRLGVVCPYIPPQYRSLCESIGISCFEIPQPHP